MLSSAASGLFTVSHLSTPRHVSHPQTHHVRSPPRRVRRITRAIKDRAQILAKHLATPLNVHLSTPLHRRELDRVRPHSAVSFTALCDRRRPGHNLTRFRLSPLTVPIAETTALRLLNPDADYYLVPTNEPPRHLLRPEQGVQMVVLLPHVPHLSRALHLSHLPHHAQTHLPPLLHVSVGIIPHQPVRHLPRPQKGVEMLMMLSEVIPAHPFLLQAQVRIIPARPSARNRRRASWRRRSGRGRGAETPRHPLSEREGVRVLQLHADMDLGLAARVGDCERVPINRLGGREDLGRRRRRSRRRRVRDRRTGRTGETDVVR